MSTTTSSYFHVQGYTTVGCFFSETFDNLDDALLYWGTDSDWREGDVVEERFESTKRSYHVIRRVGF